MKARHSKTYITFYEIEINNDYIKFEDTNYKKYKRKIYYTVNSAYFIRYNTRFYFKDLIKI